MLRTLSLLLTTLSASMLASAAASARVCGEEAVGGGCRQAESGVKACDKGGLGRVAHTHNMEQEQSFSARMATAARKRTTRTVSTPKSAVSRSSIAAFLSTFRSSFIDTPPRPCVT